MITSQDNFESIRKSYEPVFDALESALKRFDIDYYLIGAQSRDVWTRHIPQSPPRITRDIDFAVYILDYALWDELTAFLINKHKFTRDTQQPYRFYHGSHILDLIPFGGIEKDGEIALSNPDMELSVYGCREVTKEAVVIAGKYKVITLAGLCIMKLIAFGEKPDRRQKDWDDFEYVMSFYGFITGDEIFGEKYEDLITADFELDIASARMLGRNMRAIIKDNHDMLSRITGVLTKKLEGFSFDEIDQMYRVNKPYDDQPTILKLISETLKGLSDK